MAPLHWNRTHRIRPGARPPRNSAEQRLRGAVISSGNFSAISSPAALAVVQLEPVPSPLAWWTFENTLLDQAGSTNRHDGTFVGGARFDTNSPNGTAGTESLLLDGQDSGVTVTNAADLNVNDRSPFSITAWIKTDLMIWRELSSLKRRRTMFPLARRGHPQLLLMRSMRRHYIYTRHF